MIVPESGPETWGDRVAPLYDEWFGRLSPDEAVHFLAAVAGRYPALELGIGTGRVAIPLAERGVEIQGIDASRAMVAVLRAKPGGQGIPVTIGDFAEVPVEGRFGLVFVVANTFFALRSQHEQVRCFQGVGRHLTDGGAFVLEAFVPRPELLALGSRVSPRFVDGDRVGLDLTTYDLALQHVDFCHVRLAHDGVHTYPGCLRYAGRPNSTSWLAWPGSPSPSGTATGTASPSRRRAPSTSRCTGPRGADHSDAVITTRPMATPISPPEQRVARASPGRKSRRVRLSHQ